MYNPTSLSEVIEYLKANLKLEVNRNEDRYGELEIEVNLYIGDVLLTTDKEIIKEGK